MGVQIFRGIREALTMEGAWKKEGRRVTLDDLGLISKAAMIVKDDYIVWIGSDRKLDRALREFKESEPRRVAVREIDLKGKTLLPGWIDCHTHTLFAGQRYEEFEWRCQGASYLEVAQKGGGILSTMKSTRAINKNKLFELGQARVNTFLRSGVTTLEIKSGYALDLPGELKLLEVAQLMRGPRIHSTFLGAHSLPPEFKTHKDYLHFLSQSVLPVVRKKKLAQRVDIFVESKFFSVEEAKPFLSEAQNLGFDIVIHADQLSLSGGTELAIELGAKSADHVICLTEKEILKLAQSKVTAVLLPMADLYMKCAYPPARSLIDKGACVALASDFNPGSCPSQDIQLVGLLARLEMKMTLPETISAWTVGGARALGLSSVGSLQRGFKADFQVLDGQWEGLFYQAGYNPTDSVYVGGVKSKL